jgi:hypothetical protein
LVGADESLGEVTLNLRAFMRKAFQTKKKQNVDEKWLQVMHPNFEGVQGEVFVSFELLHYGTGSILFVFWIQSKSSAD